jgi:hypothetical protein
VNGLRGLKCSIFPWRSDNEYSLAWVIVLSAPKTGYKGFYIKIRECGLEEQVRKVAVAI